MVSTNSLRKSGDVQSGPSDVINSEIVFGRGAGSLESSGFIMKKLVMQFLDIWSAVVLQATGTVNNKSSAVQNFHGSLVFSRM